MWAFSRHQLEYSELSERVHASTLKYRVEIYGADEMKLSLISVNMKSPLFIFLKVSNSTEIFGGSRFSGPL